LNVRNKMDKSCQEKRDQIITMAQDRFALYGFDKTTMQEIADDLQLSKGSLYYYFPDKESLYKSIIEKEKNEFLQTLHARLSQLSDPVEMLKEYIRTRMQLSERLINLARTRRMYQQNLHSFMHEAVQDFHAKEDRLVTEILQIGLKSGMFAIDDLQSTASLFTNLVRGIRVLFLRNKHVFQVPGELEEHEQKINLFVEIFCRGIRAE